MFMMAPITVASYVLKAIVLTWYVIETSADFQAKGARGTLIIIVHQGAQNHGQHSKMK